MKQHDVIILGAGLSGLACALTLKKNGVSSLIIEAENKVGGRVQSHRTETGFIIDEGFQVFLTSYPEFQNFVDFKKMNLKTFNSGALIYNGESLDLLANPIVHPENIASTFFYKQISTKDKFLVLKLIALCQFQKEDSPLGKKTTLAFLKDFGFSENFIEFFWRPFMAGVYLDSQLSIGESFFKFLIRCFATGRVSIPANGVSDLPLQMAAQLPQESILLNQKVQSWTDREVLLSDGTKLNAKKIICAFDSESGQTSNKTMKSQFHSVETYYFTSPRLAEMDWGKWLVLIPQHLGLAINHFCLLSSVAENYSEGKPLLSVSVIGNKNIAVSQIQKEMNQIAKTELHLELIERVLVEKALPIFTKETNGFQVINGVIHCGDQWASPSINGALRSGRLAAEFVLKSNDNN